MGWRWCGGWELIVVVLTLEWADASTTKGVSGQLQQASGYQTFTSSGCDRAFCFAVKVPPAPMAVEV